VSQENVEVVRRPIRIREQSHRSVEQWLGLRVPRLLIGVSRAVLRLPTRSRVRGVLLSRFVQLSVGASNRGDNEASFLTHHPDFELIASGGVVTLGSFPERSRGRQERIRCERAWREGCGHDFPYEPEELLDKKEQPPARAHGRQRTHQRRGL
jgi:hypothetical protein